MESAFAGLFFATRSNSSCSFKALHSTNAWKISRAVLVTALGTPFKRPLPALPRFSRGGFASAFLPKVRIFFGATRALERGAWRAFAGAGLAGGRLVFALGLLINSPPRLREAATPGAREHSQDWVRLAKSAQRAPGCMH